MRQKVVLITGANGEIGHGLIQYLSQNSQENIVALDVDVYKRQATGSLNRSATV